MGERERYDAAMKQYQFVVDPVGALKAQYAHLIPKRPLTAYFLFVQDCSQRAKAEERIRAEGKEVSITSIGAKLGQLWQGASAEEKDVFIERAETAAAEYAEKLRIWECTPEF